MSNRSPCYFFAPTWDYPPEGPIKLGNVITSVKTPERPLYAAPLPNDQETLTTEKTKVEISTGSFRKGRFSILTRFLNILGVDVGTGAVWGNSNKDIYAFDRVETTQFIPEKEYIQSCIEADPVRRFLDKSRYRKPLYIIIGLKTVAGAKATSVKSQAVGGTIGVEVDGTVWGGSTVPLSGRTEVNWKRGTIKDMSWEGSSDFVFAFRVRKVSVRKTGEVKKDEDYKTGALLGNQAGDRDSPPLTYFEEDPEPGNEGYEMEELTEGDNIIACAVPRAGDLVQE